MCFRYKLGTDNYKSNDLLTTQDREPPPHPPSGDALSVSVGLSHGYLHYYSVFRMNYTTIRDWNSLPKDVLSAKSVSYFEKLLQQTDDRRLILFTLLAMAMKKVPTPDFDLD